MALIKILFALAFLLNLIACGDNDSLQAALDAAVDPSSDPDNDGLSNDLELNTYFTNINIADTDGDGISDGDEVNELGFNPASNIYRFNPLIADLPVIGIAVETVPDLVLRYTDTVGSENSTSTANGGATVDSKKVTDTGSVSVTVGAEIEAGAKLTGPSLKTKKSLSVTGTYENSVATTKENQRTWETVTNDRSSTARQTEGATLRIGVSIENVSNITYALEHITLVATYFDGDGMRPIATLGYDTAGSGFQRTSFSPGEKSNTLLFSFDDLDLDTALDVLKNARTLVVEPALFELTDKEGFGIDFNEGEVDAKTAFVLIDYGTTQQQEKYNVSVLGSLGEGSLMVSDILGNILNVDYVDNNGFQSVRGIGGDPGSRWILVRVHDDGFNETISVYDVDAADYAISDIEIFPGDTLNLIYLTDVDGDGIGIREEFLNGTDPNNPDTDGDGLTDDVEIRSIYLVNSINLVNPDRYPASVKTNPVLADADEDSLTDIQEVGGTLEDGTVIAGRGLDPNNADTDGDGISDAIDTFNGQIPIAADFALTPQGGSTVNLTGIATPQAGTRVTSVTIEWGDMSADDVVTSVTSAPLNANFSHTYPAQGSGSATYNITITMLSTDDDPSDPTIVEVVHAGSFQLFSENTSTDFGTSWSPIEHIRTMADMDNDGNLDLVGFGDDGVGVAVWDNDAGVFNGSSTWLTGLYGAGGDGGDWDKNAHPRFLTDYDGDGLTDVVGFGQGGVLWSKNCGDGTLQAAGACDGVGSATSEQLSTNFVVNSGWDPALHFRAMADVDGNGLVDIVGVGASAVFVLRNLGSGSTELVTMDSNAVTTLEQGYGTAFTTGDAGITNRNAFRMQGDINGDGRADLLLSGGNRMFYSLGQNDGSFSAISEICTSSELCFTPAQGWTPSNHLIFLEDVNNDGLPDLVGFGYGAVYVSLNESVANAVSFGALKVWSSNYTYNTGWRVGQHLRYLADVNGDGYKDIVGFTGSTIASLNQLPKGQESFASNKVTLTNNISLGSNWQTVVTTQEPNPDWFPGNPFAPPTIDVDTFYYNNRLAGDYNNDGYADVIGFSDTGVIAQRSPVIVQPAEQ